MRRRRTIYREKLVRDLAYSIGALLGACPLLTLSGNDEWHGMGADEAWRALVTSAATLAWLTELDKNPARLEQHLAAIAGLGRVANYHTALVQFFLAERVASVTGCPKEAVRYGLRLAARSGGARTRLALLTRTTASKEGSTAAAAAMCLHVEPLHVFAIDASTLLPEQEAGAASDATLPPLGALVSFDLESNLKFRLRVSLKKMELAGGPAVREWAAQDLLSERQHPPAADGARVASLARFTGAVFARLDAAALAAASALPAGGPSSLPPCWWVEDVTALVAARPSSRWAIVDWRHLLAPAAVIDVKPSALHFSRSLDGVPIVVPSRAAAPPPPLPDPPLAKGDRSLAVQALQFALIQCALMRPSTIRFHAGIYGRHTASAVAALQAACGVLPTGAYDANTRSVLDTLLRDAARRGADLTARSGTTASDSAHASSSDAAADGSHAGGRAIFARVVESARAGGYHAARDAGRDAAGAAAADHSDALFTAAPLFPSEVYGRLAAAAHDGGKPIGIHGWTKSHSGLEEAGTTVVVHPCPAELDCTTPRRAAAPAAVAAASPAGETSPRVGCGWRAQLGAVAASASVTADAPIAVIQGSLALLIPHEPVISGATLCARVDAMQQRPARGTFNGGAMPPGAAAAAEGVLMLCTVTFHASPAYSLTRSFPYTSLLGPNQRAVLQKTRRKRRASATRAVRSMPLPRSMARTTEATRVARARFACLPRSRKRIARRSTAPRSPSVSDTYLSERARDSARSCCGRGWGGHRTALRRRARREYSAKRVESQRTASSVTRRRLLKS